MALYSAGKSCNIGKDKLYSGNDRIVPVDRGPKVHTVTYYVSPDQIYYEEIEEGKDALSPSSFVPSITTGWPFLGWKTNTEIDGNVLTKLSMEDEDIVLYSVFYYDVTLSYNGNGQNSGQTLSQTGRRYYNGGVGVSSSATFTVAQNGFLKTNYTFVQWRLNGTTGAAYAPNSTISLDTNATMYAEWKLTAAATYTPGSLPVNYIFQGGYNWGYSGWNVNGILTGGGDAGVEIGPFNVAGATKLTVRTYFLFPNNAPEAWESRTIRLINNANNAQIYNSDVGTNESTYGYKTHTINIPAGVTSIKLQCVRGDGRGYRFTLSVISIVVS